jgi:hemerythrin
MSNQNWGWSNRLAVNFAEMDETHQEFVKLCAALSVGEPDTFLTRLNTLIKHSVEHFDQENNWMVEHQFASVACHVNEHDTILEIMREVGRRVALGEVDLAERLAEELPKWFEHHVDTMDNALAKFLIAQQALATAPSPANAEAV